MRNENPASQVAPLTGRRGPQLPAMQSGSNLTHFVSPGEYVENRQDHSSEPRPMDPRGTANAILPGRRRGGERNSVEGCFSLGPPARRVHTGGPAPLQDSRQCHHRGFLGRVCATLLPKWSQAPLSSASEGQADEQTNSCSACEQRGVGAGFARSDQHTCNYEMCQDTTNTK